VTAVAKVGHPSPRPVTQGTAKLKAPAWPAAASADIAMTSATDTKPAVTADGARPIPAFTAPGLPVSVAPDTTAPDATAADGLTTDATTASAGSSTPTKVHVTVVDHATAVKAGIPGEIVTVARADGGTAPAHVTVGVDYSTFQDAYGGMFANRLDLVTLPACVLTTPQLVGCQKQTKVKFTNTATTKQLSAKVTVPG